MRRRFVSLVALLAVLAVFAAGSPVQAIESDAGEKAPKAQPKPGPEEPAPEPEPEPKPEVPDDRPEPAALEIIATGLDNPRGLDVGRGHRVYVAEAGRGGPTLVETRLGDSDGPICVGMTGSITLIHRGHVRSVASLPSAAPAIDGRCEGPGTGEAATGPHDVVVRRKHKVSYTMGLGGTPEIRDVIAAAFPDGAAFGHLDHLRRPKSAAVDVTGFEAAVDPDTLGVDSNPYGITRVRRASLVVDAGGNSLLRIDRKGGVEVAAVFAPRCVRFELGPNPIPDEANPCGDPALFPADAVPTDVARHPDGDYLVAMLGGFPFVVGESVIYKVDAKHEGPAICSTFPGVPASGCEIFADRLTALVGIDVDRNGKVYAVQMADNGLLGAGSGEPGAADGSVQVFDSSGARLAAIEGLIVPGDVAVRGKWVYITNLSTLPGAGQVLRTALHCLGCGAYS